MHNFAHVLWIVHAHSVLMNNSWAFSQVRTHGGEGQTPLTYSSLFDEYHGTPYTCHTCTLPHIYTCIYTTIDLWTPVTLVIVACSQRKTWRRGYTVHTSCLLYNSIITVAVGYCMYRCGTFRSTWDAIEGICSQGLSTSYRLCHVCWTNGPSLYTIMYNAATPILCT